MCQGLQRLAPFEPTVAVVTTGKRDGDTSEIDRQAAIEGFRKAARFAAGIGISLSLEPVRSDLGLDVTFLGTLPDTIALIDEIDEPNLNVCYDVYHLWDTPDIIDETKRYASRIGSVHVADWREPTRSWADRALPGEGILDLPGLFEALEEGGYTGWYDLEIFSEDKFEDSLWRLPVDEMLKRGTDGFLSAWNSTRVQ
jgi:sugar phosphate isomerase/epimerase